MWTYIRRRLLVPDTVNLLTALAQQLGRMERAIRRNQEITIMEMRELREKVAGLDTVVKSVEETITSLVGDLREKADNPAEIRALADNLDAYKERLAQAAVAGTAAANELHEGQKDTDGGTIDGGQPAGEDDHTQGTTDDGGLHGDDQGGTPGVQHGDAG